MNPFFVFLAFLAVPAAALLWFAHRADLGDTLAEHARTYVRPYVKGTSLIAIAVLTAFDESFRNLTTEGAAAMSWWQWSCLFFKPTLAGLAVLVAFLDRSITEAKAITAAQEAVPTPPDSDPLGKLPEPKP